MKITIKNLNIEILKGDITEIKADAIVNAANNYLIHGGGVALAIVKKGGKIIQDESNEIIKKIKFLETGNAVITTAGKLKAKFVIHTVGPVYGEGNEDKKLEKAIFSCLNLAEEKNLKSIAFPAISTGIYGFPKERCAKIMFKVFNEFAEKAKNLEKIFVVLYDDDTYEIFCKNFKEK